VRRRPGAAGLRPGRRRAAPHGTPGRPACADPAAVTQIAALCAHLPLALAIAAARAAARPRFPLPAVAAELRAAAGRLNALDTGDPAASIRAVFSWSTDHLTPAAARMFRLLGLHPGPAITAGAAAGTGQKATAPAATPVGAAADARGLLLCPGKPQGACYVATMCKYRCRTTQ
jgi:hypothetical protein